MPIRASPSNGSTPSPRSATTRAMTRPTVTQAMRSSLVSADFDACVASQAVWSSKSRVNPASWRAHGTASTVTPCSGQSTRDFEDQTAWLATHASKSALTKLLRIAWVTVGRVIARVVAERGEGVDPLEGLARIGIDEISHRRGHNYLTVVVDHDSGRLVWTRAGRNKKTMEAFFDDLGERRCAQIRLVSADAADWIGDVVADRCTNAVRCMDPFHVVQWVTDALDEVRRDVWNSARRAGQKAVAKELKGARYALWKNPEDLTERQQGKLADIAKTNQRLYRAYLLKEQLRQVFHQDTAEDAIALL